MGKTCLQSKANLQSKVNHVLVGFIYGWEGSCHSEHSTKILYINQCTIKCFFNVFLLMKTGQWKMGSLLPW